MSKYKIEIKLEQNEYFYGGNIARGNIMPYGNKKFSENLLGNTQANQSVPMLISNHGTWIWCEDPIAFELKLGILSVESDFSEIKHGKAGHSLREAFLYCSKNFFPPKSSTPDEFLFSNPQYNTWIELMYDQNEDAILDYAHKIIDNAYPPGVLMIDDTWQENYGVWEFAPRRFKDPAGMIEKLHRMGFKVMLWVCPFVSADSPEYRTLAKDGLLLMEKGDADDILWSHTSNLPAIIRWWNGASGVLDLTNPKALEWFKSKLDYLQTKYKVDGFKFDAGDAEFYSGNVKSYRAVHANAHTESFAALGIDYPFNELRASWKLGGQPIAQRLRDKRHSWDDLSLLIPDIVALGLTGHPFTCPDMIGGGEYQSFLDADSVDQELVVRSAQCSALMPMMQFSAGPWRVLDKKHNDICRKMADLHLEFGNIFLEQVKQAAISGEPIIRNMEYNFPDCGFLNIKDQFMLGENILVAPVLKKGQYKRKLVLPEGEWLGDDGNLESGTTEIDVPIERLPYYKKMR